MSKLYLFILLTLGSYCFCDVSPSTNPIDVHLSLTTKSDQMMVAWKTESEAQSLVTFRGEGSKQDVVIVGESKAITFLGPGQMHFAIMTGLKPATLYTYKIGGANSGWSDEFTFKSPPVKQDSVHLVAYGDQGVMWDTSKQMIDLVSDLAEKRRFDVMLHCGDLAYSFENASKWDAWFRWTQPITSRIPYMIAVGNRDDAVLDERFRMPTDLNGKRNRFFSFDYGVVHVISLSTEDPYAAGTPQWKWLRSDLELVAADPRHPWIIVMAHKPMYSSSNGHKGGDKVFKAEMEPLFHKYGVTLAIFGDDHDYERSFPLYNDEADKEHHVTTGGIPRFHNPRKTIHILAGTGGIELDGLVTNQPDWSAIRLENHGYVSIEADTDDMRVKFVRLDGKTVDNFEITKTRMESQGNRWRTVALGVIAFLPIVALGYFLEKTSRSRRMRMTKR